MTQPESAQPEEAGARLPEGMAVPAIEPIAIDALDKENRGWVVSYLAGLRDRLGTEQGADRPDFVMIGYLKREVATYQDLLDRTDATP